MKRLLLLPTIMSCTFSYGATGNASDGQWLLLLIIAALSLPLGIDYLVRLVRDKICKHV